MQKKLNSTVNTQNPLLLPRSNNLYLQQYYTGIGQMQAYCAHRCSDRLISLYQSTVNEFVKDTRNICLIW